MGFSCGKNCCIKDEKTVYIDDSVIIGDNVTIYENNRIEGNTVIEDGTVLLPNNYIINAKIGKNCKINNSQIENAVVFNEVSVGPFARLRPNTILYDKVQIGNFVEVKNSTVGEGTKANHLAYIGDADVGRNCNIGCGAIFVNYNGRVKQRTSVGDNCFIGSNCNVIAPVNIDSDSYICAGTTVTNDVHSGDFVIGRVRQEVKENRAQNYLKVKKENN